MLTVLLTVFVKVARFTFTTPLNKYVISADFRSVADGTASYEIGIGMALVVRADVLPHLVMPVGPFVSAFRPPVVEMMCDAAMPEDLGHSVSRSAILPRTAASHEPYVTTRVLMEIPRVALVGHVVHRVIKVEVVVVHPIHRVSQIVNARERVAALHVVGMLEEGVGRVIGTE